MTIRNFIKAYFKSPLGSGGLSLGLLSFLIAGVSGAWLLGLLLFGAIALFSTTIGLFTLSGARAVLREEQHKKWSEIESELSNLEAIHTKLKVIRISDEKLAGIVLTLTMRLDRYLVACRKQKTHDPVTSEQLLHVPELVDALLSELDETSIEKRFKLDDQHEFPLAKDRVCAELERIARLAEKSALDISGELLPSEYMETRETL